MKTNVWKLSALALLLMLSWSCRKEDPILPELPEIGTLAGFYLLNEGTNKEDNATLDYCDLYAGRYLQNVYKYYNSTDLGDTGNDLAIYGTKLYAVINGSNKVEIMQAGNAVHIRKLDIPQPRFITFSGGKAYVSAYDGKEAEPGTVKGMVVEIDTASLEITRRVLVGRQPEELAVVNGKLYVANSGWGAAPAYENTVSVINLSSFTKEKDIEVADNLKWLKADKYDNLYVSSLGNYNDVPAALYILNTRTEMIDKSFNIPVSNLCVAGDSVYVLGSSYDADWNPTYSYDLINAKTQTVIPGGFIHDGTDANIVAPYGIAVDPKTKNVYVTDAGNYTSPGKLYGFDRAGQKLFSVTTGVIPAHFAFVYW